MEIVPLIFIFALKIYFYVNIMKMITAETSDSFTTFWITIQGQTDKIIKQIFLNPIFVQNIFLKNAYFLRYLARRSILERRTPRSLTILYNIACDNRNDIMGEMHRI